MSQAFPDDPDQPCLLAAKRYRGTDRRLFHRHSSYAEGRQVRSTVATRATADRKSTFGRQVRSAQWVSAEWDSLKRLFEAGIPVPYWPTCSPTPGEQSANRSASRLAH